jgi:hypothetical protein
MASALPSHGDEPRRGVGRGTILPRPQETCLGLAEREFTKLCRDRPRYSSFAGVNFHIQNTASESSRQVMSSGTKPE